jgi:hypothetical protein
VRERRSSRPNSSCLPPEGGYRPNCAGIAFKEAGAEVVGVNSDSDIAHEAFAGTYRLPFTPLAEKVGEPRGDWRRSRSWVGIA